MAEVTLFNERGITITTSRLVVESQTYAVRAITSTKQIEVKERQRQNFAGCGVAAVVLFGLGFAPMLFEKQGIVATLAFLAVVAMLLRWVLRDGIQPPAHQPQSTYVLAITTASGEVRVVSDQDASFVRRVNAALTEAMVAHA